MPNQMFEKITSIDNLRKAWVKVYQYARTEEIFFDEYSYAVFGDHLEARLADLAREVQEGNFRPSPIRYIKIPKGLKERKIYFLSAKDSVVIQAVINVIGPIFERTFAKESFGNRLNVNDAESKDAYHNWQDKYSEYVSSVKSFTKHGLSAWYLITDIENFYPSISKEWLVGLISKKVDTRTLELIKMFLDLQALSSIEQLEDIPGIPPGPVYSHFFANIYLDGFDHLAINHSLGYARYVDDICLVCSSEEKLDKIKGLLSNYLNRWDQNFKEVEKTIKRPIIDIEPLLEHTRRMKYATRLDFVETTDVGTDAISIVGSTEKPFYRLYKIAEREGDVNRIIEEAGFVLFYLKKTEATDFDDVIYSLLETNPLRPSTIKAALIYLLELESSQTSTKFWDNFFGEPGKPAYLTALFLRFLGFFDWPDSIIQRIISSYCNDPDYLVRATAYLALQNIGTELDEKLLMDLLENEESIYVKQRIIQNFSKTLHQNAWLALLNYLSDIELSTATIRCFEILIENHKLEVGFINSIWAVVRDLPKSMEFLLYLIFIASKRGFFWIFTELLETEQREIIVRIFPAISREIIQDLASDSDIIMLHLFANQVSQLGFQEDAMIGFYEVAGRSNSITLADEINHLVREVDVKTGLPEWANNENCTRTIYRGKLNNQGYFCQYLDDGTHRGIREVISIDRVKAGGFTSLEDWEKYVKELSDSLIVPPINISLVGSNKIACFYEFPKGYSTIANIYSDTVAQQSLSGKNVLRLGLDIIDAVIKIKRKNFCIHSIDPLGILWSPLSGDFFFIGVGASLGVGKYLCGIDGCRTQAGEDEIGISATVFHLGLFLFELLSGHCPLEPIFSTRSRFGSHKNVYDLVSEMDVLPHYKMILGRLLMPDPETRYSDLELLKSDIEHANNFFNDLEEKRKDGVLELEKELLLILSDFIAFRLKIIARNPSLKSASLITTSTRMINELSNTIRYLPQEMLSHWKVCLETPSQFTEFPSKRIAKSLSPEGRRLTSISYGWEKIQHKLDPDLSKVTSLSRLFLYRTLSIEAMSSFAGNLIQCTNEINDAIREQIRLFCNEVANVIGDSDAITLELRTVSNSFRIDISNKDILDLQRMAEWRTSDLILFDCFISLKIFGLFFVIISTESEIYFGENCILQTKTALKLKYREDPKYLWLLLRDMRVLDEQIEKFQELCYIEEQRDDSLIQNTDVWLRTVELISFLRMINPAVRKSGEVYSYQVRNFKNDADGIIDLTGFRKLTLKFDTRSIHVSGNPTIIDKDFGRPVLVDYINSSTHANRTTSVLAPIGKFTELPFREMGIRLFTISKFLRKKPKFTNTIKSLILIVIILLFWAITQYLLELISGSSQPVITGILSVILGIFSIISSKYIDKIINTVNPENNDLLLKGKR